MKNKKIKYLLLILGIASIIFFLYMNKKHAPENTGTEHKQLEKISVKHDDENIKTDGETGWKVQSDVPYYNGKYSGGNAYYMAKIQLSDFGSQKAEEDIKKYTDMKLDKFAKDASTDNDPDSKSFRQWEMKINVKHTESKKIDSYLLESYEYTGGAHGNHFFKSFNYDKKTGQLLTLDDILSSKDALKELSKIADKYFLTKKISYEKSGAAPKEENWPLWYADANNIVFVFPPSTIASSAVGEQRLPVSVEKHKEVIKEEYR